MSPSTIERHLPTFVACYRRLPTFVACYRGVLVLIRVMCRVGTRLFPRAVMVIVLVMTCDLAWIVFRPEHAWVLPAISMQTLVGFSHGAPGPWPRGNCFSVWRSPRWRWRLRGIRNPGWGVRNMHAENFSEIVKRLGLKTVEVLPLNESSCLITDPRIPREWLLEKPCALCVREPVAEELLARYPGRFRDPTKP